MWANSVWGLFSFALAFGLAVLALTPEQVWLRPWFTGASIMCAALGLIVVCWPLRHHDNRAKVGEAFKHPRRWIANTVETHLIPIGLAIILVGVAVVSIGVWRHAAAPFTIGVSAIDSTAPIPQPIPKASVTRLSRMDAGPPKPEPKRYTAYEKEQRLRAADEFYDVFTAKLTPAFIEGRDLFNGLKNVVAEGLAPKQLRDHYGTVENAFKALDALRKKYAYYPDIVAVTTQNTFNGLNEMVACDNLISEISLLQNIAPNNVGQFLDRDVVWMEARNASREFDKFMSDTMSRLKQKRQEIESAEIYAGTSP
jgi:hypothetical protein